MNNKLIIFLFIIILLMVYKYIDDRNAQMYGEQFVNYTQCKNMEISERLKDILEKEGHKRDDKDWDLYLPCGYTNVETELKSIPTLKETQKIFAIDGCDKIVSKYWLWKTLEHKFGDGYSFYTPRTYSCDEYGIQQLLKDYKQGNKYIAKKDIQRQSGLTIIHDIANIQSVLDDSKNIVIQELLKNPLLIDGHKINMRVYFAIICKNNNIEGYIHSNGFIYYTPEKFDYTSQNDDAHITTGYIDRKIYQTNPLTHDDLYKYLVKNGYNANTLKENIKTLFRDLMDALKIPVCQSSNLRYGTAFQLFGCDIAPDNNLNVKLIEINKGPDLNAKDTRDNLVKNEVTMDLLELVDLIRPQNKENRFIKIW